MSNHPPEHPLDSIEAAKANYADILLRSANSTYLPLSVLIAAHQESTKHVRNAEATVEDRVFVINSLNKAFSVLSMRLASRDARALRHAFVGASEELYLPKKWPENNQAGKLAYIALSWLAVEPIVQKPITAAEVKNADDLYQGDLDFLTELATSEDN